jgi:hypothetical protein
MLSFNFSHALYFGMISMNVWKTLTFNLGFVFGMVWQKCLSGRQNSIKG